MRNKVKLLTFMILLLLVVSGCQNNSETPTATTKENNENVIKCSRTASTEDNMTASLNYSIYYEGEYVTKTVSIEKVTSNDKSILEKYRSAYETVFEPYKDIDYYDNTVDQTDNTVTSTTVINYKKVDTSRILEIEGEDGNIYDEDGKVKKDTLVAFYEKYGSECK